MWRRLVLAVFILLCFEVGAFLFWFPWSGYWERNWVVAGIPVLAPLFSSGFMRGAVAGLGLLNILAGLSELFHFSSTVKEMALMEEAMRKRERAE